MVLRDARTLNQVETNKPITSNKYHPSFAQLVINSIVEHMSYSLNV
jgi:hypothetical protein